MDNPTSPLSPEAVAQMVADREAGTPGPWSLFDHTKGKIMAVCIGRKANGSRPCIIDSGGFDSTDLPTKQNRANARRIARLPDLEAAYLTLAAENATLRDRAYKLAVAICGGEDAPGYADSIDVETLEDMARELNRAHMENADEIDELATLRAERDEWQLEVAMCIMACPPGKRTSPASEGVKLLRASEAAAMEALAEIGAVVTAIEGADSLDKEMIRNIRTRMTPPSPPQPTRSSVMSAPTQFRKKPVVISAIQWTGENLVDVIHFTDGRPPNNKSSHAGMMWDQYVDVVRKDGLKIFTMEGKMDASIGDWIIKGVKGEHYPCKPEIFALTYDDASASTDLSQAAVAAALEAAKIAELIAAGDVMANALRGHYIVPGSAGAWQKAVDAMQIGAKP